MKIKTVDFTSVLILSVVALSAISSSSAQNEPAKNAEEGSKSISRAHLKELQELDAADAGASDTGGETEKPKQTEAERKATQLKASSDAVVMQMYLLRSAVVKYQRDHQSKLPLTLDADFKHYFPVIRINNGKTAGPFYNPYTKQQDWFDVKPIENLAQVEKITEISKGKITYCPLTKGTDYAIIGGGDDEHQIRDKTGKSIVLTKAKPIKNEEEKR